MSRRLNVGILVVEEDRSAWPRISGFFTHQLAQVGANPAMVFRDQLPQRAAGFDLISLTDRADRERVVDRLLDRPDLLMDLRHTPIVNLHAPNPGAMHSDMRTLLGREGTGLTPDGLWVFSRDWMAPWFEHPLEFPELGLALAQAARPVSADRTWARRSRLALGSPLAGAWLPLPAGAR